LVEIVGDALQLIAQLEFVDFACALCEGRFALLGIETVECLTKKIV